MLTTGNDVWFMGKPSGGFHLPYMERNCVHRGRGGAQVSSVQCSCKMAQIEMTCLFSTQQILFSDRNSISVGRIDWGGDFILLTVKNWLVGVGRGGSYAGLVGHMDKKWTMKKERWQVDLQSGISYDTTLWTCKNILAYSSSYSSLFSYSCQCWDVSFEKIRPLYYSL